MYVCVWGGLKTPPHGGFKTLHLGRIAGGAGWRGEVRWGLRSRCGCAVQRAAPAPDADHLLRCTCIARQRPHRVTHCTAHPHPLPPPQLSCTGLKHPTYSAMAVVYELDEEANRWYELGRTELMKNNLNPTFINRIK